MARRSLLLSTILAASALPFGCSAPAEAPPTPPTASVPAPPQPPPQPPPAPAPARAAAPPIPRGEPLKAGLVELTGVVRPTKGGYHLRGVAFDREAFEKASKADEDALFGAKARVVAVLKERPPAPPAADGVAVQARSGGWMATKLVEAEVLAPPELLEGTVSRSKGLFQVGDRMVSRDDLAWALPGKEPVGKRVRLWGQPRDYHCPPMAQCLIEGVIPMFDIGRAELAP